MAKIDHTALVDGERIQRARDNLAALEVAARDTAAEVGKAEAAVKETHAAAQRAADGGADVDQLLKLEAAVEDAERKLAVAKRMAEGAKRRLAAGVDTHASEVKQSHGKAMNSGMQRFIAVRGEAQDALATLEALGAEHGDLVSVITGMARDAGSGIPGIIAHPRKLLVDGKLMDQREFDNRLNQPAHHEFDVAANKLRWVEEG